MSWKTLTVGSFWLFVTSIAQLTMQGVRAQTGRLPTLVLQDA